MRDWIKLCETLMPIMAYHGTIVGGDYPDFDISHIKPLTHFGSRNAALSRSAAKLLRCYDDEEAVVLEFQISIGNPFWLPEHDGDGVVHTISFLIQQLRASFPEITNENLIETLIHAGYDGIAYNNRVEDAGSSAYIILSSEQAHWINTEYFDRDDMIDLGYV